MDQPLPSPPSPPRKSPIAPEKVWPPDSPYQPSSPTSPAYTPHSPDWCCSPTLSSLFASKKRKAQKLPPDSVCPPKYRRLALREQLDGKYAVLVDPGAEYGNSSETLVDDACNEGFVPGSICAECKSNAINHRYASAKLNPCPDYIVCYQCKKFEEVMCHICHKTKAIGRLCFCDYCDTYVTDDMQGDICFDCNIKEGGEYSDSNATEEEEERMEYVLEKPEIIDLTRNSE